MLDHDDTIEELEAEYHSGRDEVAESSSAISSSRCRTPVRGKKRKYAGSFTYGTQFDVQWITKNDCEGIIVPVKNDRSCFHCNLCNKDVSCGHQGELDLKRHICGKVHTGRIRAKSETKPLTTMFVAKNSESDLLARKAELRFTGFLAEHNLPLAAADHLGSLIRCSFPDSKIAQNYSCARTKSTCLLNDAISPDLLSSLVSDMQIRPFSLCVDGSNDSGLQKMNPITVRIYDDSQHKVCCKFLNMCPTCESTADAIFKAVSDVLSQHTIPWQHCVGFGVDNTSVNVGRHNSVKTKVTAINKDVYFMGCACHMSHNAARHACAAFRRVAHFDVDDFMVNLYFWFEYSSKRKNCYVDFCSFTDIEYRRILKFLSVRWLGLSTCLERVLQQFAALKSYFLSTPDKERNGGSARLSQLVRIFENPMTEYYCFFIHACLPVFVNFNLLLQRADPVIPLMYDAMIDLVTVLLNRVLLPNVAKQFKSNPSKTFSDFVTNTDNQLDNDSLFIGFGLRRKLLKALDDGDITDLQYQQFLNAARAFNVDGALYSLKVLPIDDLVLKHAGMFDLAQKSKFTFSSVEYFFQRFKSYIPVPDCDIPTLETEFVLYQSLQFDDLSKVAKDEACIRVSVTQDNEAVTYRADVLWHYMETEFLVAGTQRSKFHYLAKMAKLVFTLPHSNADEERVFSRVNKNKTKFRESLSLDRTLSSIVTFQMNRPSDEPCYKYAPNVEVCKKAKKVTWEYNKAHSTSQS